MITVIVSHQVQDFDAWLPGFEAHESMMREYGFTDFKVLRSTEDANMVTVVGSNSNPELMKKFFESDELKNAMMKSGVIGMPTITTHHTEKSHSF